MASARHHPNLLRGARAVSVLALSAVAGDHLYVYVVEQYSAIPTIGTLFLLNAIGGFGLAAALLVPLRKLAPRPRADQLTVGLAVAGIVLSGGALAGLFVSESTPLFGFMEMGYRTSIVIAIISEVTAIVALLAVVAGTICRPDASRRGGRDHPGRSRLVALPDGLSGNEADDR